jgi:iron complex transport system ATP-binding protein
MILRCRGLGLAVPGRVLCRDVTVEFAPGEIWAVLGRNGTGKSTLIHALAGLAAPYQGVVELDGASIRSQDARLRARSLGVLLQMEAGTYWGSAADYVLLGRFPHASAWAGYSSVDLDQAAAALDAVGMGSLAAQKFDALSGGERQRARIAQILAQSPRIFLLDEPLQHLDLAHQSQMLALIRERVRTRGETAVMVMHEPLWIGRSCTHALLLDGDGSVASGPAEEVLTRARLEHAYGCALREVDHGGERSFVPDV